ncbi:MAG: nitroreductase family protein [Erysipelotrichales bacterium]|nr:nitroreductase family protein [Erysipelotrichales bacterium]
MDWNTVVESRYSVRLYKEQPVEEEKLRKVLETGNKAPTAKNVQPHRIYVLKSEEALARIRSLTRCAFNAPVVLLVTANGNEEWHCVFDEGVVSGEEDAAIVSTYMMLEAAAQGLGTCWVNYFPHEEVKKAFGLPEEECPVLLMPIGYAAEESVPSPNHTKKRPLEELVKEL